MLACQSLILKKNTFFALKIALFNHKTLNTTNLGTTLNKSKNPEIYGPRDNNLGKSGMKFAYVLHNQS